MQSVIRWYGGKTFVGPQIVDLFGAHETYYEAFAGSLWVLLNKNRCKLEVASDRDIDLIRMWKGVQSQPFDVIEYLQEMEFCRDDFERAKEEVGHSDLVIHSGAFIARNRMSFNGLNESYIEDNRDHSSGTRSQGIWEALPGIVQSVAERIQLVVFSLGNALEAIPQFNNPSTLIYADPPYLMSTRGSNAPCYKFEMTVDEHRQLLWSLKASQSQVYLSGYSSALYKHMLLDWMQHDFDTVTHAATGDTKDRRVESVWTNQTDLLSQLRY